MTFTSNPLHINDTERKCAKCGQWKPHSSYGRKRGRCRSCIAEDSAARYRALPPEKLDRLLYKQVVYQRRKRAGQTASRIGEARGAIRIMRKHGFNSYRKMEAFCGVTRDNLSRIDSGKVEHVKTQTLEKLYDAVNDLIGVA